MHCCSLSCSYHPAPDRDVERKRRAQIFCPSPHPRTMLSKCKTNWKLSQKISPQCFHFPPIFSPFSPLYTFFFSFLEFFLGGGGQRPLCHHPLNTPLSTESRSEYAIISRIQIRILKELRSGSGTGSWLFCFYP